MDRWTGRSRTRVYVKRPNSRPRMQTTMPESRISCPVNPRKSPWFRSGRRRFTSPPGRCSAWAASWAVAIANGAATGATAPSNSSSNVRERNAGRTRFIVASLLGFNGRRSVGADGTVTRVSRGVRHREEALRQLVGLALADLVGLDGHQRVVAALGLHRHADLPDGAGERAPVRLLLHRG